MAFKRLREIKTAFKQWSAKMSPEKRDEWKEKFVNQGLFEFREQTAQVRRTSAPGPPFSSLSLTIFTLMQIGSMHYLVRTPTLQWPNAVLLTDWSSRQRRDEEFIAMRARTFDLW